MTIDTNMIVTATEANQNFSRVSKLAEEKGHVIVFKNNRPKLLIIDLDTEKLIDMTEDKRIDHSINKLLTKNTSIPEELPK